MEARQIEAFRAAATHSGFTRGAIALGISQPSLTRSIARLEENVGFKLFERGRGSARLTPEGHAFLREVERRFVALEQLRVVAHDICAYGTGRLAIACMHVANSIIPGSMQRFTRNYPEVMVSLQSRPSDTVYELVAGQRCELGFAQPQEGYPSIHEEPFISPDGVVMLPARHRLARLSRPLAPEDLANEPFISLAPDDPTRKQIDSLFQTAGIERRLHIETQYAGTICALVGKGVGVSIVNPIVAVEYAHLPIKLQAFEPKIRFESVLLWSKAQPLSNLAQTFAEMMLQEAEGAVKSPGLPNRRN